MTTLLQIYHLVSIERILTIGEHSPLLLRRDEWLNIVFAPVCTVVMCTIDMSGMQRCERGWYCSEGQATADLCDGMSSYGRLYPRTHHATCLSSTLPILSASFLGQCCFRWLYTNITEELYTSSCVLHLMYVRLCFYIHICSLLIETQRNERKYKKGRRENISIKLNNSECSTNVL